MESVTHSAVRGGAGGTLERERERERESERETQFRNPKSMFRP
jgi:hypothetical protein